MIVAGFGHRAGATAESLRAALALAADAPVALADGCPTAVARATWSSPGEVPAIPTKKPEPPITPAKGASLVDALAASVDKCPLVAPLAQAMGLPLIAVPEDALAAVDTPTRSPASLAARGVGSVAEAAALAAAGPGARLIVSRRISPDRMATCAIAEGASS